MLIFVILCFMYKINFLSVLQYDYFLIFVVFEITDNRSELKSDHKNYLIKLQQSSNQMKNVTIFKLIFN